MKNQKSRSQKVAVLGVLTAVTVVLQLISYTVKIGTFNLSLVLIPIVVSGCLYGPYISGYLGAVFGVVTVIGCVSGIDAGGYILFTASPFLTVLTCMLKGTLCGILCGITAKSLSFKKGGLLSVVIPAVVAPVTNTGIFILMMILCFSSTLYQWAGNTATVTYILTGLIGINFLIELFINVFLSPVILRVIKALSKTNREF